MALLALVISSLAWEYEKILPVLPLIYEQNIYDQSSFSKVDMSLMHTECEAVGYHTVHTLGDILLDQSTGTTIETRFRFYDTELCGINMPTYENSFSKDVFLIKPKNLQLNDADHKILMDIYRYHHGFNETCPNADEAEMEIETGRIVPRLPVLRKRAFIDADILDRILTNSRQRESETVSTRTKEMEASLAALNRDYVTAIQKITALQTSCETAVAKSKQLENDLKDYETSAATLTEHQNKKNTTLTAQVSTLENEKEALEQNTRSLEDELIEVRDKYENAQETTINLKSHSEGATNTALELQRVHQQLKKI